MRLTSFSLLVAGALAALPVQVAAQGLLEASAKGNLAQVTAALGQGLMQTCAAKEGKRH